MTTCMEVESTAKWYDNGIGTGKGQNDEAKGKGKGKEKQDSAVKLERKMVPTVDGLLERRRSKDKGVGKNQGQARQEQRKGQERQLTGLRRKLGTSLNCRICSSSQLSRRRQQDIWGFAVLEAVSKSRTGARRRQVFDIAGPASVQAIRTKATNRRLRVVTETSTPVNMDMRVARVQKALVSAGDVTDKGPVFTLSKFGSFVAHDPTGQISQTALAFQLYNKNASTLSPFQRRQEQASAWWQYQRHHQRQHHHEQCKEQHLKDQWQHHHRHLQEGMRWRELRWVFYGRSCGFKTRRGRR